MVPEVSGPPPAPAPAAGGLTRPWPPGSSSRTGDICRCRAGSTTDSTSPGFGAGGDPLRRMAVPSETASTCSSDSAIMDVVKASAGGGDYAMTEGHSPATHSQAGAEFSSEREDRFPFGLPPGVKPHGLDSVTMSVASMDVDRAMLSPSASPQTSGQPWLSSQHPAPSPQRRSSRTQSPPRGPADPRQPSEDDARPGSDDEPHAAAAPPGWPGAAVAQPQQQQQQMQQALPHPGWPQTAGYQDQHSGRASPQHDQQQREHQQQREQQQLERRQRREARRQSPAFTPSHCPPAPVPMPHPLQLQYQQQCLQDPLFAHPRYRKICDLNRGAHGFVQRAIDMQTGEEVACKFIERGRKWKPKHLLRELVNQKLCAAHPHIVHLREAFLTPHHLGIAMEYADSGDLLDFIDTFAAQGLTAVPEADARRVFQQMMVAVDYCHRLGIANRDIKLDNVLLSGLDPQLVKLCDFGYSKDGDLESACKTTCGTPEYMAPEVLLGDAYDGQRVDMWSCGCSLYILLVGNYPFRSMADNGISHVKRMQAMFPRIMAGAYTAIPTGSPEVRDLIHRLLRPNPAERLTMAEVFAHPWFQMDLADGALQLNDTLLAAVGADYAASGDLQERIDILQQAESGGNGQTVAELVALVNAAVEPLHHEFFDTRRRPSGLTVATR